MLEPTSTCIHKSIFHIIKNPEFSSDTDIHETIDSIICDYLHRCYAVSIEPSQLCRGLMKSNDETCSIRSAFVYPNPSDKEFLHWATLIRIHDAALRRRNWTVRIGLTRHDASSATLYHAVSYSDHQAGSFSVFRPPVLTPPLLPQLLLSHPGLRCQSGRYALSDAPWALTGSDIEEFIHFLYDQSRALPIALITCPDLVSPSALCRLALGNLIVCWLDDPQVFDLLCDRLPQNLLFPWDSVKVFLPFSKGECFHPVLRPEDIQRMGGQEALAGIYRAYCTCPTGEERRAFIDLDVVYSLLGSQSITSMKEQIDQLRKRAEQLEHENNRLHEQCIAAENARQALEEKLAASDIPTYEALLEESTENAERLRSGIQTFTEALYGKNDSALSEQCCPEIPVLKQLAEAILFRQRQRS